jgi:hypothetical protein
MAKWENFTADRVAGFKCHPHERQSIYWEAKAPGLGLRVTPAGTKAYIFETRLHGRTMRITIGDIRTWPIGKAQAEATRLKALTDQDIDPRQQKAERAVAAEARRERATRIAAPAMAAWRAYIEARRGKWGARHLLEHETVCKEGGAPRGRGRRTGDSDTTLPGILRPLLILPLEQIDSARVRAWLKDEAAHRPTYARLALSLLRAFLNWCSDRDDYRDQVRAAACTTRMARDELPKKTAQGRLPATRAAVRLVCRRAPDSQSRDRRIQHTRALITGGLPALSVHGLRRSFGTLAEWVECPAGISAQIMGRKPERDCGKTLPCSPARFAAQVAQKD